MQSGCDGDERVKAWPFDCTSTNQSINGRAPFLIRGFEVRTRNRLVVNTTRHISIVTMVRSVLALSLLGLSAVNALPAQPVEERQTWIIGPPSEPSFGVPARPCDAENPGACFFPPVTGGLNPSPKSKRDTISFGPIESSGPSLQCSQAQIVQQILRPLLAKENPNKYELDSIIRFTDILRTCGFSISDDGATLTKLTPRSEESSPLEARQEFRIGCGPWEVSRLIDQYNYLRWLYGINTERWPQDARIQRQTILNALESCNQGIQTGPITPQPTIPGGPLVPEPVIPGGAIVPQPVIPGGSITPEPTVPGGAMKPPKKRGVEAAQEALQVIEDAYGTYDQGKVPAFIAFAAEGIVADLRNSGIVVIGWPKTTIGIAP